MGNVALTDQDYQEPVTTIPGSDSSRTPRGLLVSRPAADRDHFAEVENQHAVLDIGPDEGVRRVELDAVMLAERGSVNHVTALHRLDGEDHRQPRVRRFDGDRVAVTAVVQVDGRRFAKQPVSVRV